MANQTIALQAQNFPIDLPGIVSKAQAARANDFKLQNMPLETEIDRLKLNDERGKLSALEAYRGAAGETDQVSALPKLNSYPELQSQFANIFDGMTQEQKTEAARRLKAYGAAAQIVQSFKPGSEQQKTAWNNTLQVLLEDGHMDRKSYDLAMQSGPNDLLLNQAIETSKFADKLSPKSMEPDFKTFEAGGNTYLYDQNDPNSKPELFFDSPGTEQKAPQIETFYDQATGKEYKATWNGREWVKVGGVSNGRSNGRSSGKTARNDALKELYKIAADDMIARGTPEYDALKAAIFEDFGVDPSEDDEPIDVNAAPGRAPEGVTSGDGVLAQPPPMNERVEGKTYKTPKGPAVWTKDGWVVQDR